MSTRKGSTGPGRPASLHTKAKGHHDHAPTSQAVQCDGAPMQEEERQRATQFAGGKPPDSRLASKDADRAEHTKSSHQAAAITRPASTWRDVLRAHERRAADFARRFAHRRSGP